MDAAIWLYIALGIIVLGLIIAGIGIGMLIAGAKEPMKEMKGSADNLKSRMDKLTLETTNLQHTTSELKEDIQQKSEKVSVLVNAAKGTINSAVDLNAVVRSTTDGIANKVEHSRENAAQVDQWKSMVVIALSYMKNRKTSKKVTSTY